MSTEDERLAAAFADLAGREASGADLRDVRDRIRRRRTRRAAVAGSVATVLAIGGIALGAQSLTSGTAISPAAPATPSAPATDEPADGDEAASMELPTTSMTLTVAGEEPVELDDFAIYCTRFPGGDGLAPDPVMWLEGIDYGEEGDDSFSLLQVLLFPELVATGDRVLWGPRAEPAANAMIFGLVGEAENSSREEGTDLAVDILSGDGCTPGSTVALQIEGTLGSEFIDGDPMRVDGAIVGTVTAEPGFVDPTGELPTDCSAVGRRDVPDATRYSYEPLGEEDVARVMVGRATFVIDESAPACETAPGIGAALAASRRSLLEDPYGQMDDLAAEARAAGEATRQAQAFVDFALDPSTASADEVGFAAEGVRLTLNGQPAGVLGPEELARPTAWSIRTTEGSRFSALDQIRLAAVVRSGEYGDPLKIFNLQVDGAASCDTEPVPDAESYVSIFTSTPLGARGPAEISCTRQALVDVGIDDGAVTEVNVIIRGVGFTAIPATDEE